jgi:hypothetical protein
MEIGRHDHTDPREDRDHHLSSSARNSREADDDGNGRPGASIHDGAL